MTKPKIREAPAAKAPTKRTPQDKMEIELLIAHYKWLEADQTYQAAIAKTNEESDELIHVHDARAK